jgi:hypothetical protein
VLGAHELVDAEAAGQGAGEQHRNADDPRPARCRRRRRPADSGPNHPQRVSPAGAPDEDPDQEAGGEREDDARLKGEAQTGSRMAEQPAWTGRHDRARPELPRLRRLLAGLDEDVDQQVGHQRRGDEVEHDRRDHDVAAAARLEPRGDECPGGAEDARRRDGQREHDPRGQRPKARPTRPDAEAADVGLPLAADVEQAGVVGDGHGEAGEDEVRRVEERVADRVLGARRRPAAISLSAAQGLSPIRRMIEPGNEQRGARG